MCLNIKKEILQNCLSFKKGEAIILITALPVSPFKEKIDTSVKLLLQIVTCFSLMNCVLYDLLSHSK